MKRSACLSALCATLIASQLGHSQSVKTIETYGPAPATQAYQGLGTNINPYNAWEYASAQAAHMNWGRFDCSWGRVEVQNMPAE